LKTINCDFVYCITNVYDLFRDLKEPVLAVICFCSYNESQWGPKQQERVSERESKLDL